MALSRPGYGFESRWGHFSRTPRLFARLTHVIPRIVAASLGVGLLAVAMLTPGPAPIPTPPLAPPRATTGGATIGCAGGCSAVTPWAGSIDGDRIAALLAAIAPLPPGTECPELDELLFYWPDAEPHLAQRGAESLGPDWHAFLAAELARHDVQVSFRVIDAEGVEFIRVDRVVRLNRRSFLVPDTPRRDEGEEVITTVRRVGPRHFWARL